MRQCLNPLVMIFCISVLFSCSKSKTPSPQFTRLEAITLSKDTISVIAGSQISIGISLTPANTTDTVLSFASSDATVATVKKPGIVTGLKVGSAIITVSSLDGAITQKCFVKVLPINISALGISKTVLSLLTGQTDSLYAIIQPPNATFQNLGWETSDTAVATVSGTGVVSAKQPGSCTIRVSTADGKNSAVCQLTVAPVDVSVITFSQTQLRIDVGLAATLTATILPLNATFQTLVWSSTDATIASVNNSGLITAKKAGSCTITAATTDGKHAASCQITVTSGQSAVTGIKVDSTRFQLLIGTSLKMGYTLSPGNALNNGVTWSSDNTAVATVGADGTITAVADGFANITAKTADGGFTSGCVVNVVHLGVFIETFLNYAIAGGNERMSIMMINFSRYNIEVFEYDISSAGGVVLSTVKATNGSPLYTVHPGEQKVSGVITVSWSNNFIEHFPMVVYFDCNGKHYKMTTSYIDPYNYPQVIEEL